ncbi:hypothetical protein BHE74_00039645 [Ensete ventricosum]|nr:hypothetical protein GW17_00052609 [Ensete ventricosum]RWW53825.1 hypothetical protein BHE74_00039645 [Ensete ventricosum]
MLNKSIRELRFQNNCEPERWPGLNGGGRKKRTKCLFSADSQLYRVEPIFTYDILKREDRDHRIVYRLFKQGVKSDPKPKMEQCCYENQPLQLNPLSRQLPGMMLLFHRLEKRLYPYPEW